MDVNLKGSYRLEGLIHLIYLASFVLCLVLLIISLRLLQQNVGGFSPPALLVFSIMGLIGSAIPIVISLQKDYSINSQYPQAEASRDDLHKLISILEQQNDVLNAGKTKLDQENLQLRTEIKLLRDTNDEWFERSIEVLKTMERIINVPNIDESYLRAILKTKKQYSQLVNPMGVHILEPKPGDKFFDKVHQIVQEAKDESKPPWTILECVEWGYMINGRVHSPAKVIISRRG